MKTGEERSENREERSETGEESSETGEESSETGRREMKTGRREVKQGGEGALHRHEDRHQFFKDLFRAAQSSKNNCVFNPPKITTPDATVSSVPLGYCQTLHKHTGHTLKIF